MGDGRGEGRAGGRAGAATIWASAQFIYSRILSCFVTLLPPPPVPSEYMVRAPMPPVYFFAIDVTHAAAASGALAATCRAIRASLDGLPGDERTRVGFLTYDRCEGGGGGVEPVWADRGRAHTSGLPYL